MRYITPEKLFEIRFKNNPRPEWKTAVICFRDRKGSDILLKTFKAKPVGYKVLWGLEESKKNPYAYKAEVNGNEIGIIASCMWGGPQAAILVEELAALGIQYLIGYGAAGSITEDLAQGCQIAAAEALCTDGASRMYSNEPSVSPGEDFPDIAIQVSQETGTALNPVAVATVDAVYRETPEQADIFMDLGAQVINMETSPFYAASNTCGVKSIWFGHVSDCLGKEWKDWNVDLEDSSRTSAEICLKFAEFITRT